MAKRAWVSAHNALIAAKFPSIGRSPATSLAVLQELTTIQP
jgi:hypothetical protein